MSSPKNVMKITNPLNENVNMNNIIRGVDFEVLPGNPGAVALFFHGAQGATVQDVSVRLANDSFAGFGGASGAGGSHMNVRVTGGRHAMWIPESEPAPLIAGAEFLYQSSSAIVFAGSPPLVLVGVLIRQSPQNTGPAVSVSDDLPVSAIDTVVECGSSKGSVFRSSASIHLENFFVKGCGLLVEKPVAQKLLLAECDSTDPSQRWVGGGLGVARPGSNVVVNPRTSQCMGVEGKSMFLKPCREANEFAYDRATRQLRVLPLASNKCVDVSGGLGPRVMVYPCHNRSDDDFINQNLRYDRSNSLIESVSASDSKQRFCIAVRAAPGREHPNTPLEMRSGEYLLIRRFVEGVDMSDGLKMDVIYQNGVRHAQGFLRSNTSAVSFPPDIVSRHVPWEEASFPSFERSATANAKTVCGASGDGETDDHLPLQSCLDKYQDVFLPKGRYRLGRTLKLNPGNRLVGVSMAHSVLMPVSTGFGWSGVGNESDEAQPLIITAPGSKATIAFVGLMTWWHLHVFTLLWQSSGGLYRSNYDSRVCECLWLENYRFQSKQTPCRPSINLTVAKAQVSGTGAFVNFVNDEDIVMTDHRNYRHLLVSNNSNPADSNDRLRFYELNMEHAMSEANMELNNAHHVDVFGLKMEGSNTILWIRDSSDVTVKGVGPSADAFPNTSFLPEDFAGYPPSILRIERSSNFSLFNLVETGRAGIGKHCQASPITPFPLTPKSIGNYDFSKSDIHAIIKSEWAPWPGYYVNPRCWNLLVEADGPKQIKLKMRPLDRPIAYIDERHPEVVASVDAIYL
eukprot:TRINITY_DN14234_c0_g1_i3.p1 TRINITY_DN14234_c0_g1~~TRINITY_DN14234_c0_g1_i3.p1  ORF type:complete len:932 (+),score=66.71 TRINITY_DN14234_c0_g1_i3:409-2796(+)